MGSSAGLRAAVFRRGDVGFLEAGLECAEFLRAFDLAGAGFLRGASLEDADARLRAAGRADAPAGLGGGMAVLAVVESSENI